MLVTVNSFSQIKAGIIEYDVVLGIDEKFSTNEMLKEYYSSAVENSKYLKFKLLFNKEKALFTLNKVLTENQRAVDITIAFANIRGNIYYLNEYILIENENTFGKFLIKKENVFKWELKNETKIIDQFLCYKATTDFIVVNEKGRFVFPVVAWYCPKIPLPYGPNGYGGLPGLILELQEKNTVFGAKTINLNPKEFISIKSIDDSKAISEKDFDSIMEKKAKEMFDSKD